MEQARAQQLAALRAEQKEIILDYLRQMQTFHDFAAELWHPISGAPARSTDEVKREARQRSSELWFCQKKLLLVASPDLRKASLALTEKLEDAVYKVKPEDAEFWLTSIAPKIVFWRLRVLISGSRCQQLSLAPNSSKAAVTSGEFTNMVACSRHDRVHSSRHVRASAARLRRDAA